MWTTVEWNVFRWLGRLDRANPFIRALFVTPLFVHRDMDVVRDAAKRVRDSSNYNAIASLVDLQDGRDYIFRGRTGTALDNGTRERLREVILAGVTPVVIVRNDWAIRTGQTYVPSVGGRVSEAQFYSDARLQDEKRFLESMKEFWPYVHFQLSIEPQHQAAAAFSLKLAQFLRGGGFGNRILINPYKGDYSGVSGGLASADVFMARSLSGLSLKDDPVVNLDGNLNVTRDNAATWTERLRKSGRMYIMWSRELANLNGQIPNEYLWEVHPCRQNR